MRFVFIDALSFPAAVAERLRGVTGISYVSTVNKV